METRQATAVANANIALIKYWGHADPALRIPANSSLSMNLAGLETVTTVEFDEHLFADVVTINDEPTDGLARTRVVEHLDRVRSMTGLACAARVESANNFPAAAGLASSASAFAALSLAAALAAGLQLDERTLSMLARLGSGSACRSVPAGFVEWTAGDSHTTSYAHAIAPPDYWDIRDLIAIVDAGPKAVSSREGHDLAGTSFLQPARIATVPARLAACKQALLARDLPRLGEIIEEDALAMHAVMMTSRPSLLYWEPATLAVVRALRVWRTAGLPAYFTIDAGPNVHCLCETRDAGALETMLRALPGVLDVLSAAPGPGVHPVV
jgi:diphosphomevalonate decarboxylase